MRIFFFFFFFFFFLSLFFFFFLFSFFTFSLFLSLFMTHLANTSFTRLMDNCKQSATISFIGCCFRYTLSGRDLVDNRKRSLGGGVKKKKKRRKIKIHTQHPHIQHNTPLTSQYVVQNVENQIYNHNHS